MTEGVKRALRAGGRSCLGVAFRSACRRGGFELYHEPNDLSVLLYPEWHPADRVHEYERRFRRGLANARHVLTDSNAVRREVIAQLGVAPEKATAVPLGVGPEFAAVSPDGARTTRNELRLPPDYLLYVGTIEPRKNVLTILHAYCALPTALQRRCPLVLAGGWGWKSADVAECFRREAADKGVIHLGYTDDRHLPGLYAAARALVYPSYYEGFGLPPLEMLASGGAVLSSTAVALREVLGQHAHYVDPRDVDGWRDAMTRVIRDDDWLDVLRQGGRERAAQFRWEHCATETAAVYRSILSPARQAA
jgi:alpha-1,3-rhamnosyl/mannosyltransferase